MVFRKDDICSDNMVKQVMKKWWKFNLETHLGFINYEKPLDQVDRGKPWHMLERRGSPWHMIRVLQSISHHINNNKYRLRKGRSSTDQLWS